jgi:hypothetical protein
MSNKLNIMNDNQTTNTKELPTKTVVFFTLQNGKYVADNGVEITTQMVMEHEHYISKEVCYIVLP